MKKNEALKRISIHHPELKYPTGFEDAVIGIVERFSMNPVILMDRQKVISILMKRDKMSFEDAIEYYEFNIVGSWMGGTTPCFAEIIK